jgi:uncharacterized membrane protein
MILDRFVQARETLPRPGRSWQRSLLKTITWRLFATVDTFLISILVTGSLRWAGSIVGIEVFSKMALYFLHERAWGYARWGITEAAPACNADPEYQLG